MEKQTVVNVGVIGLGAISYSHIPVYQADPRVNLLAVCDINPSWLAWRKNQLGVPYAYTDYRELLNNKEIDAISICVPNYLHKEVAVAALKAGKHVLCEKPMALNVQEAQEMHLAAQASGKKLMISHNQRFGSDVQLLKKQMEAGLFGEVYFIRIGWQRPMGLMPGPFTTREDGSTYSRNWFNEKDRGGGVLRDLGSHLIDLAMYLAGFPKFQGASCNCYRKFYPDDIGDAPCDSEDLAAAHIKFENGLSMQLEVSFGSYVEHEVCFTEIYGTKAGASRRNGNVTFIKTIDGAFTTEKVDKFTCEVRVPMQRFIDCIIDDTVPPVTSAQGMEVIRVLDALYQSAGMTPNG